MWFSTVKPSCSSSSCARNSRGRPSVPINLRRVLSLRSWMLVVATIASLIVRNSSSNREKSLFFVRSFEVVRSRSSFPTTTSTSLPRRAYWNRSKPRSTVRVSSSYLTSIRTTKESRRLLFSVASSSIEASSKNYTSSTRTSTSNTMTSSHLASPTEAPTMNGHDSSSIKQQQQHKAQKLSSPPRAKRVSIHNKDEQNRNSGMLQRCGQRLRQGNLVAFPTETVYGLGCNALNPEACHKVFQAKQRPLTDPLIAHVHDATQAYRLWQATSAASLSSISAAAAAAAGEGHANDDGESTRLALLLEKKILQTLCQTFWPGPLTLVARARSANGDADKDDDDDDDGDDVPPPSILMAGTGFVACRSPVHPTARALIQEADVPIAAPSANTFGHVSPTTAQHVWDDLNDQDVWIVENDRNVIVANGNEVEQSQEKHCEIGVESTVAKVEVEAAATSASELPTSDPQRLTATITVLRHGAISASDLESCLKKIESPANNGDDDDDDDDGSELSSLSIQIQVLTKKKSSKNTDHLPSVAPGQTIRHYSPRIPSFVLSQACVQQLHAGASTTRSSDNDETSKILRDAVIVDFGRQLQHFQSAALAYRDLSNAACSTEAAKSVFDTLRWAEQVPKAKRIFFPSLLRNLSSQAQSNAKGDEDDGLLLAVQDRLMRAASGVVLDRIGDYP